jgi:hypothetical protein
LKKKCSIVREIYDQVNFPANHVEVLLPRGSPFYENGDKTFYPSFYSCGFSGNLEKIKGM